MHSNHKKSERKKLRQNALHDFPGKNAAKKKDLKNYSIKSNMKN
jgi:hypothetical protein